MRLIDPNRCTVGWYYVVVSTAATPPAVHGGLHQSKEDADRAARSAASLGPDRIVSVCRIEGQYRSSVNVIRVTPD